MSVEDIMKNDSYLQICKELSREREATLIFRGKIWAL